MVLNVLCGLRDKQQHEQPDQYKGTSEQIEGAPGAVDEFYPVGVDVQSGRRHSVGSFDALCRTERNDHKRRGHEILITPLWCRLSFHIWPWRWVC